MARQHERATWRYIGRWAWRAFGALGMACMAWLALGAIVMTLSSNMDRWWAGVVCCAVVMALIAVLRMMWQAYFADATPVDSDADADAEPLTEAIVVSAPMNDTAMALTREALAGWTTAGEQSRWV